VPIDMAEVMRRVAETVAEEAESAGQMTLGAMIAALKVLPPDKPIGLDVGLSLVVPHSYRGYYEQLAFDLVPESRTVADLLADAESAKGSIFDGYKGGDFRMTGTTMIWAANYGCCGQRIVGVENGPEAVTIRTAPDEP
jgi:hypothetical protein